MRRNPSNFLYNLGHVTLWCVEVGPVENARVQCKNTTELGYILLCGYVNLYPILQINNCHDHFIFLDFARGHSINVNVFISVQKYTFYTPLLPQSVHTFWGCETKVSHRTIFIVHQQILTHLPRLFDIGQILPLAMYYRSTNYS